jgi:hypothetical protein
VVVSRMACLATLSSVGKYSSWQTQLSRDNIWITANQFHLIHVKQVYQPGFVKFVVKANLCAYIDIKSEYKTSISAVYRELYINPKMCPIPQ